MISPFDIYMDLLKDRAEVVECRREENVVYIRIAEHINPEDKYLTITEYRLDPDGCSWAPLDNIPLKSLQ